VLMLMRGALASRHPLYCLLAEFGSCSDISAAFSVSLAELRVTLLAGAYQMLTIDASSRAQRGGETCIKTD
jgi:hypothetical protein